MYTDYKGNKYSTLAAAVTGALSEQNTDVVNYASYINVKRAYKNAEGNVVVPSTFMTTAEIANAVDSDNVVFIFHNTITGQNVRSNSAADLNFLVDSASTNWKSWRGTKTLQSPGGSFSFTSENDSDALIDATRSLQALADSVLESSQGEWLDIVGLVLAGDRASDDSDFVRLKDYRQNWKNISSHPNWPDLTTADFPSNTVYENGLYMYQGDSDQHTVFGTENGTYTEVSDVEQITATNSFKAFRGYFEADSNATYTFTASQYDDLAGIWVGDAALNPTSTNATALRSLSNSGSYNVNNPITMIAGQYYPVYIKFINKPGPSNCVISFTTSTGGSATDLSPYWKRLPGDPSIYNQ